MNNYSLKSVLKKNTMIIVMFIIYIFFAIMTHGGIFYPAQFTSLINQNAYVFVLGTGMLMCMLTGGNIDLSVGSFVCFIGAIAGVVSVLNQVNTPLSLLIVLVVGIVYGVILGYLIAFLNIPPWIATLAGYLAFRGAGTEILTKVSDTSAISNFPEPLLNMFSGSVLKSPSGTFNIPCLIVGVVSIVLVIVMNFRSRANKVKKGYEAEPQSYVIAKSIFEAAIIGLLTYMFALDGGIPVVLVWVVAIMLIYNFVCEKTVIGRHFMTVGGNGETARLSGINNKIVMFAAYLNMSILTVIASLMVTARFKAANSFAGQNFEMDAISACIIGGVSAYGGAGTVGGMAIGAALIGIINLGMSLMGIDQNWQKVVKGGVLLAAVVFDIWTKKNSNKK
ncbi:MAG: sugar ABC transporter permease [Clostridiales bacterium]|nr:sugar ABC transporter permease [Clostridiales bacterium]MBR6483682.1 sugar ABC transporter permease [Clostridiales bacterium]